MADNEQPDPAEPEEAEALEPKPKPEPVAKRRVLGQWSSLDRVILWILVVNFVVLAGLMLMPSKKGTGLREDSQQNARSGDAPHAARETPRARAPASRPEVTGKRPLLPRHRLFEQANAQAAAGNVAGAIGLLERLLKEDKRLGETVRRSVYVQLSYYCGLLDRSDDAMRWLRLSRRGFERGLLPDDLWRLAEAAYEARDFVEARRYAARFLLLRSQQSDELAQNIPVAYLRLADGYREQATAGEQAATAAKDQK